MIDNCFLHTYLFLLVFLFFGSLESGAQVINDNIEYRLELKMNKPLRSNTSDCTLQWACLNHVRTKKLIQYHNDQWFFFNASNSEKQYINISGQECRDLRGVQLMLIHGEACEPDGYEIVDCVSLGDQDDVFLELNDLETNEEYLVLIDGYLHDNCGFVIEFSDSPQGLPIYEQAISPMNAISNIDFLMELHWSVPDSIADLISRYEVYRRHDGEYKSTKVHEVEQGFNARGVALLDYDFEDVLPGYGKYKYKIIGVRDQGRLLISSILKNYRPTRNVDAHSKTSVESDDFISEDPAYWLEVDLNYPNACKLKITVFDASSQEMLKKYDLVYNSVNTSFRAYIKDFKDKGIDNYKLEIVEEKSNEKRSHLIVK